MKVTFAELSEKVHFIKDLILTDMLFNANVDNSEETKMFSRRLFAVKYRFSRISWANKRRFLMTLLEDVQSAWTLSLTLKSIWNCRPKDAVMSISELECWSSFDQVPMDHNRTAQPIGALVQILKQDRKWFLDLEPDAQVMVLTELLKASGGPIMWEVLRRAQSIYEKYRDLQLQNLLECVTIEQPTKKEDPNAKANNKVKKDTPRQNKSASDTKLTSSVKQQTTGAQKMLDIELETWNAAMKSMRDSMKLEELEMTFKDGTVNKIWKVNRPRPEAIETVDFLQLLPSPISKRILSYIPVTQLSECAKVNKYWAYLVEDLKAEFSARAKIDAELEKLKEVMLRHDPSLDVILQMEMPIDTTSVQATNILHSVKKRYQPSIKFSDKSAACFSYRNLMLDKMKKSSVTEGKRPIRNMADFNSRLDKRGALDENVWEWCHNIVKRTKKPTRPGNECGVMSLGSMHFPCPLMKYSVEFPLSTPLRRDPTDTTKSKPKREMWNPLVSVGIKEKKDQKRYNLWSRDLSSLYPVIKIASYQTPI